MSENLQKKIRMHYILDSKKIVPTPDINKWLEFMDDITSLKVANDKLGKVEVSTVFLGRDHGFSGGPPVLFETMISGGELDPEWDRYCTYEQAELGHKKMVQRVKERQLCPSELE